jgi:peptide/nickel transport system substrate-binding protein
LFSRPSQLQVFRERIFSGETMMAISKGFDNGLVTADTPPMEFVPVSQQQLQWPKWGQYAETKGRAGEAPDMPLGRDLLTLLGEWFNTEAEADRKTIWEKILAVHADQIPTIGLVAGVPQPVVINNKLRNVPDEGVYNWDPGAHFGMYRPDAFWFATDEQAALPPAAPTR